MAAFKKALALRVTTLEFDVQATKDPILVVHHDPHLNPKICIYDDGRRVPKRLIEELSYGDLAKVDCGQLTNSSFPAQRKIPGERIPRLQDVLALVEQADYPARLSIEMKWQKRKDNWSVHDFARRLIDQIKQYNLQSRTIIQSFYPTALRAARGIDPNIARAILVEQPKDYDRMLSESTATILSPRFEQLRLRDVKRFRDRGIPVIPWTVNGPADICRLISWEVDGIISDYPDRVIALYGGPSCEQ
jgi:glycerophosphoryl diester phosphodiesterase